MFEPSDPTPGKPTPATRTTGGVVRHTPADLRQRRFGTAFRGFERTEVVMFLTEIADDLEQALHEIHSLERDLHRMEEMLEEHRTREQTLRDTLLTAQKLSDEIRTAAEEQAEGIVRDAESRADVLMKQAETRLVDVEREIDRLRDRRSEVESEIEASIASLQSSLDEVRGQDRESRDDRIRLMRPRQATDERPGPERRREGQS